MSIDRGYGTGVPKSRAAPLCTREAGLRHLAGIKDMSKIFPRAGLWKGWYRGVGEQLVAVDVHINDSLHPRNKRLSQCCCLPRGGSPRPARQSWQFGILLTLIP